MSARVDLLAAAMYGHSHAEAEALIDEFVHELAERQRNWDAEAEGYTDPQMAVYAVADLIDPKVDDGLGLVRPDEEPT